MQVYTNLRPKKSVCLFLTMWNKMHTDAVIAGTQDHSRAPSVVIALTE